MPPGATLVQPPGDEVAGATVFQAVVELTQAARPCVAVDALDLVHGTFQSREVCVGPGDPIPAGPRPPEEPHVSMCLGPLYDSVTREPVSLEPEPGEPASGCTVAGGRDDGAILAVLIGLALARRARRRA